MNAPEEPVARPKRSPARRIAAAAMLSAVLFVGLWLMVFSALTSALVAAGCCVVVLAASAASDPIETVLDVFATIVFGLFAAIATVFAAIVSLFGW